MNSSLNLQSIAKAVEARLEGASWLVPQGAKLVVSKAKDARNPHTGETAAAWLVKAQARREELSSSVGPIEEDLKRWLPSSWPLTGVAVQSMVQSAATSLDEGLRAMRQIEAQSRAEPADPSP